jgi:hypothetical protein
VTELEHERREEDEPLLLAAIEGLSASASRYASEYFGHFLNETQIIDAQAEIAQMATAASRLYEVWQRSRAGLPTSAEIGRVVAPPTFRAQLLRLRLVDDDGSGAPLRSRRFSRLVTLNERVRRASETVTEALPIMRNQILYARHYERNCARLYGSDDEQVDRLRDAEDMRLAFEQILRAIEGDVESLRAQAQSLTLYAQMLLAVQIQVLTWILLLLTAAGVVAAFLNQ